MSSQEDLLPILSVVEPPAGASRCRVVVRQQEDMVHGGGGGGGGGVKMPKQESSDSSGVPPLQVYYTRWYILTIFSLLACHQCLVWNTWGPIAEMAQVCQNYKLQTQCQVKS